VNGSDGRAIVVSTFRVSVFRGTIRLSLFLVLICLSLGGKIDIGPRQPQKLPLAHPGMGGKLYDGPQRKRMPLTGGEQPLRLLRDEAFHEGGGSFNGVMSS